MLMPGGGLEQAPAGWSVVGPGPTLVSVSVAGVLGGASGDKSGAAIDCAVAEAAGGAAHFFLSTSTCHQASISLSSSLGLVRAGWRRKAASCPAENSFRMSNQGMPLTTSLQVTTVSPQVRLFIRIMTYCTKSLISLHRPP